ncbi:DUF6241 domain-containing protein [Romboutsia sp.]|uniref:DUF6241 domain-containing protein n=1 Tax=Romboutsia sp. TaxID=1965302 RepID=UPI002B909110|nr:DUF6241 domain-containing protein [Romboutsia sp.]HSQ87574.1 DUF6241 domain-containing protein [Romboutsia sp.]
MSKSNKEKLNNTLDIDLDYIDIEKLSIEEIDEEIKEFYIDKEKIDAIKVPDDMKFWIKEAIDKAEKDMKVEKIIKKVAPVAASISIILSIVVYNPVLAHAAPPIEKILQNINDVLHVDEIASDTGLDKIIPKATLDKNGKIKFIKAPRYKVEEIPQGLKSQNQKEDVEEVKEEEGQVWSDEEETEEKYIQVYEEDVYVPFDEDSSIQLIHEMSNGIIHAVDDMKRGYTEISPKTIDVAIEGLKNIQDEGVRNYLHNELNKWKNGEFDNGVEVHNCVWNMLDGEIGRAGSIDYKEVEKIKNNHFR